MSEISSEVSKWLAQQPMWLQLMAHKLLTLDELSANDYDSAMKLLKGVTSSNSISFNWDTLKTTPNTTALKLADISQVQGIENLSPRVPLQFGIGNLTVVYGHNGSGKSGYSRILKRICGKPRAADLKSNVFQTEPSVRGCRISFQYGTELKVVDWAVNAQAIPELTAVDIFDTDEAQNYLAKENNASYIPPLVALFEKLVEACELLKSLLQAEQNQLMSQLPTLPTNFQLTIPGSVYKSLHLAQNKQQITSYFLWPQEKENELDLIVKRLNTDDPATLAVQLTNKKTAVDQLTTLFSNAANLLTQQNIDVFRNLRAASIEKRRIASEAGNVTSAKLTGVGTKTWMAMWEAARAYSQTVYPKLSFPVTEPSDSRCLLCHQELDDDASKRLRDFETFVQGQLESDAKAAEQAYSTALSSLGAAPTEDQTQILLNASGLITDDWKSFFLNFWQHYQKCCSALLSHEVSEVAQFSIDVTTNIELLKTYSNQLEIHSAQFTKDAAQFDRQQATNIKLSLEAHKWISEQTDAIKTELQRLAQIQQYDSWKDQLNPRRLTMKAGELSEILITKAYVARFNCELVNLGASKIQVELVKTRATKGAVLHQLKLKNTQKQKLSPESILSEGERRIVALAAFLADVSDKPIAAPFVFDDPISSLDHDFEWQVASRLVKLATHRQVLVFTHRLSLYGALEDLARKMGEQWKKTQFHQVCIETYNGVAGQPVNQAVWNSKTEAANNILISRLVEAKKAGEVSGADAYKALAQGICSDFRKLLERTVEEDLLYEIVKRHRRSVTTENKLPALHLISPADCSFIDGLMTKYSFYEHSQSQERPSFIPDAEELSKDLENLKNWRKEFTLIRAKALGDRSLDIV